MWFRLVIDENTVYEIDDQCMTNRQEEPKGPQKKERSGQKPSMGGRRQRT